MTEGPRRLPRIRTTPDECGHPRGRLAHHGFEHVVETTSEAVMILDRGGAILYANPTAELVTGFRAADLVGRPAGTLIPGGDDGEAAGGTCGGRLAVSGWADEVAIARRDGSQVLCSVTITPVFDGRGRVAAYVALVRDVTTERELDIRARRGRRMDALGQLSAGIAHDFNNLLAAILGFGEFVLLELPPESAARQDMEEVLRAARSASDLTRQLLAFGRQEPSAPGPVDLAAVVDGVVGMLRRLMGANVELRTSSAMGVGRVMADVRALEQVIVNLVINARDAMPTGGTILIHVEPAWGRIDGDEAVELVRLSVTDTGVGMTPETIEHIHEPFFTTKAPEQGTGLGLATVFAVVRAAGGRVSVTSRPGRGTRFTVELPAVAATPAVQVLSHDTGSSPSQLVLLVETDRALRAAYGRQLRAAGFGVIEAASADLALELLAGDERPLGAVVADVTLPGIQGEELIRRLRTSRPDLAAVLLTGAEEVAGSAAGIVTLNKPFSAAELTDAVRSQLDQRRAGDEAAARSA